MRISHRASTTLAVVLAALPACAIRPPPPASSIAVTVLARPTCEIDTPPEVPKFKAYVNPSQAAGPLERYYVTARAVEDVVAYLGDSRRYNLSMRACLGKIVDLP